MGGWGEGGCPSEREGTERGLKAAGRGGGVGERLIMGVGGWQGRATEGGVWGGGWGQGLVKQ